MKQQLSIALLLIAFLAFTACSEQPKDDKAGTVGQPTSDTPASTSDPKDEVIEFSDKLLEGKIRDALKKPDGDITAADAASLTVLNIGNESFDDMNTKNGGVNDISALKYFIGLKELSLAFNNVSDLTPLSGMTQLESLDISGTQVEDLSPIKDLTSMKCLAFCWLHADNGTPKGIGSLDALERLENLEMVDAKNAGITDISALEHLPKLWEVQLNDNEITDITPLAGVKTLKALLLEGNPITDYSPLSDIYTQLEGKDFEIK